STSVSAGSPPFDAKPLARWSTWNGDSVASVGSGGMTDDDKAKAAPVPSSEFQVPGSCSAFRLCFGSWELELGSSVWYRAQDHAGRFTARSPIQPNAGPLRRGRPGNDAGGAAVQRPRLRAGSSVHRVTGPGGRLGDWDDDQPIARGRRRRRRDRTEPELRHAPAGNHRHSP